MYLLNEDLMENLDSQPKPARSSKLVFLNEDLRKKNDFRLQPTRNSKVAFFEKGFNRKSRFPAPARRELKSNTFQIKTKTFPFLQIRLFNTFALTLFPSVQKIASWKCVCFFISQTCHGHCSPKRSISLKTEWVTAPSRPSPDLLTCY